MGSSSVYLQCLLGLQCRDFTMIAADQMNTQSIVVMKNDEEKLHAVSEDLILGIIGDPGDAGQFAQFIAKNIQLYRMKNSYTLHTAAVVHFTRTSLAESLKSGTPTIVNMLLGGYDPIQGGQLYTMDFLASCVKVPFAVHGFGGMLSLSILDRYYKFTLSEAEAYDVLKMCVHEVHQRLFVNLPNFQVKSISKNGINQLETITPATFVVK